MGRYLYSAQVVCIEKTIYGVKGCTIKSHARCGYLLVEKRCITSGGLFRSGGKERRVVAGNLLIPSSLFMTE